MNLRRPAAAAAAALLLASATACGADSGGGAADEIPPGLEVGGAVGTAPEVAVDGFDAGDEVRSYVVTDGDGPAWTSGEFATIHLVAANGGSGDTAFSSYDQGQSQLIKLDPEQFVGPQFAEELDGVAAGSRVVVAGSVTTLVGEEGLPEIGLEPGDDVVFVVDVLSVVQQPEGEAQPVPEGAPEPVVKNGTVTGVDFSGAAKKPASKLQVIPLVDGEGPEVEAGEEIVVRYHGVVYGEKEPFDESYSTPTPAKFEVGTGKLIQAWDRALVGLTAGSRVLLVVPPGLGYGEEGAPPDIPPGATLVFVVDVLASSG